MLGSIKNYLFAALMICLALGASAQAMAEDQTRGCTVLVLGDSLSAAYNLKAEQGWVAMLQRHWQSKNPQIKVVNGSVSGATTADGLQRLPRYIEQYRPQGVIIELGGNDGLQGKPIAYIGKNIEQLIASAQKNSAVFLVGMRLPPNFGARYTEPFFYLYADLSKKYHTGYDSFLLDGVAVNEKLMLADGIHPNQQGQSYIFERIAPQLDNWLNTDACEAQLNTTMQ